MYHSEGVIPPGGPMPSGTSKPGFRVNRRLLLMGVGGLAIVVIGAASVAGMTGSSDSSDSSRPKASSRSAPSSGSPAPSPGPSSARTRAIPPADIDNERTDRRPLKLSEVFPARPLSLGGRVYKQDKTSVNHQCSLVARGAMAQALVRGGCRGVVRATYVDTAKRLAITAGVVAMPSRARAVAASKAGKPSEYEWFRGMVGKVAKKIDQAGGYAASTVRGRYIIYSYTTYLDGHAPATNDRLIATVGKQFVAFAVRPIEQRAK